MEKDGEKLPLLDDIEIKPSRSALLRVAFAVHLNGTAVYDGLSLCAGAQDDFVFLCGSAVKISVVEFIVCADFDNLKAFLNEIRAELPEFFKSSVAVKDGADVLCGVVSGDAKIVCHNCFLLLSGKFFDGAVGIRQPDFVDVMQHVVARPVGVFAITLQYLMCL